MEDFWKTWTYGEYILDSYQSQQMMSYIPDFVKRIGSFICDRIPGMERMAGCLEADIKYNYKDVNVLAGERTNICSEFYANMLEQKIDCIVSPGLATPATKNYHSGFALYQCMTTAVFNLLNMPTAVIPVTTCRKEEEVYETKYKDMIAAQLKENMKGMAGLPVGVQIST